VSTEPDTQASPTPEWLRPHLEALPGLSINAVVGHEHLAALIAADPARVVAKLPPTSAVQRRLQTLEMSAQTVEAVYVQMLAAASHHTYQRLLLGLLRNPAVTDRLRERVLKDDLRGVLRADIATEAFGRTVKRKRRRKRRED
jgi:hypothetical protein